MRKGIKYPLVTLGVIAVLLLSIAARLVNAGRDTSPPPLTKAPEKSVPAGDIGNVNLAPSSWDPQVLVSLNERNATFGDSDVPARGTTEFSRERRVRRQYTSTRACRHSSRAVRQSRHS